MDHMVYDMDDMSSSLPSGMVKITVMEDDSDDNESSNSIGLVLVIVGLVVIALIIGVVVLVASRGKTEEQPMQEEIYQQEQTGKEPAEETAEQNEE